MRNLGIEISLCQGKLGIFVMQSGHLNVSKVGSILKSLVSQAVDECSGVMILIYPYLYWFLGQSPQGESCDGTW